MVTPEDDRDDGCSRPRVSITVLDRRLCSYPVATQTSKPVVARLLARFLEPGPVISKWLSGLCSACSRGSCCSRAFPRCSC